MRRLLGFALWIGLAAPAGAQTTVGFDDQAAGTAIGTQYAGVSFDSLKPVVRTPPAGQAQSGQNVADLSTCACEFPVPGTIATLSSPAPSVSVAVGLLGTDASATVTLTAFDSGGTQLAKSPATVVTAGAGVHTRLALTAAGIVRVKLSASANDNGKQIAIDDFSFGTPMAPPAPDFSVVADSQSLQVVPGAAATDGLTIGRIGGSAGAVDLRAGTLPAGLHAAFDPTPVNGSRSTLTISADAGTAAQTVPVTITGTPETAGAGGGPRSTTVAVTVAPAATPTPTPTPTPTAQPAGCVVVRTRDELVAALVPGATCVYVADDASINVTTGPTVGNAFIRVPDGVTLMGGRSPTTPGGLLYADHGLPLTNAIVLGNHTRVTGLRIRGDDHSQVTGPATDDQFDGILVDPVLDTLPDDDVMIDNNEVYDWPNAAIGIGPVANSLATADHVRVTNNFIHDNVQCDPGGGYGVVVGGDGIAQIDHNVFNYNRHDVAGDAAPTSGYVATRNFSLGGQHKCANGFYNQHYDEHGTAPNPQHKGGQAGLYISIEHNAIRGAQTYNGGDVRRAFDLRGTPAQRAIFTHNTVTADTDDAVKAFDRDELVESGHLLISGNRGNVNTTRDLAVGDFDGDGHADVFQPTGSMWAYAPQGRYAWRILHDSDLYLGRLSFGDFDGDGKTDVFSQSGDAWRVSYGAATTWQNLPAGSAIPTRYYRFGDFDGDGKTDIFRANGEHFILSSGAASPWKVIGTSSYKVGSLRFGDFDGDGRTDVFSFADDQWSVSDSGTGPWRRLNAQRSDDLDELRFADFDGDGRTDIAREHDGDWQVSWGGRTKWQLYSAGAGGFGQTLIGDFDGDGRADVLSYHLIDRYRISAGSKPGLAVWSRQPMF